MINFRMLSKKDMLMLRTPLIVFFIACAVAGVFYYVLGVFSLRATRALNDAQTQLEQISTSVEQIAQEEQTITRYIGRYSQIEADGVVSKEDRLQLLEDMTDIRSRYLLYPIDIDLSEQTVTRLEGDIYALNPVGPVDLQSTRVSFKLPLLHEEDFTNFTRGLQEHDGLLLPQHCTIERSNLFDMQFDVLGDNLHADCTFLWYTFNIDVQEVIPDEY